MKKTLKINSEIVNELQRLSIEVDSRKELISFMIGQDMDIKGEKFQEYEKDYQKFFFEYETAKKTFEKEQLQPVFGADKMIRWNLDFNTEEVTVEVRE